MEIGDRITWCAPGPQNLSVTVHLAIVQGFVEFNGEEYVVANMQLLDPSRVSLASEVSYKLGTYDKPNDGFLVRLPERKNG